MCAYIYNTKYDKDADIILLLDQYGTVDIGYHSQSMSQYYN